MVKRKKLILIFSIVLLIFILSFFLYLFFYKKAPSVTVINVSGTNQKTLQERKIEIQNDLANFNKAQKSQDANSCNLVKDDSIKNFCVQEIAFQTKTTSTCLLIDNKDGQSECSSQILFRDIVKNKNLADCEKIDQTMFKKSCIESIAEKNYDSDCSVIVDQDLKNTCLSIIYYQQAKAKNNSKVCLQIPELIRRANCLSEIGKIDLHSDADKDGLDFLQEILNNTDPNNPDTDGDGYKDGDEVRGGFNPDGVGPISTVKPSNIISCSDIKDELIKVICSHELKDQGVDINNCSTLKDLKLKAYCLDALKLQSAATK